MNLPPPGSEAGGGSAGGFPDGFEPIEQLGAGATAVVWLARPMSRSGTLALKVWRSPLRSDDDRRLFSREVARHRELSLASGHIVPYHWSSDRHPAYIETEPFGQSLQHKLEQGRPPLDERLVLCRDLLAGLAAMHARGCVHRDIKPGNVLTDFGRAKLCDMGLALGVGDVTENQAAGTPLYLAPELMRGDTPATPRSDVYSAAMTVREVLGQDLASHPDLNQLLTAATSVREDDRPDDAIDLLRQFEQLCEDLGYSLPNLLDAPMTLPSSARTARRFTLLPPTLRRRSVLAAAGVLVLGAAILAAAVRSPDDSDSAGSGRAGQAGSAAVQPADAAAADPDIRPDGRPIVGPSTMSGRCNQVVKDAAQTGVYEYDAGGKPVAVVQTYASPDGRQSCAKLIKSEGSAVRDVKTYLALTLCGDGNRCDHDWNVYPIDAGPVHVPSSRGCTSWRVSILDVDGSTWLVRDDVRSSGCAA